MTKNIAKYAFKSGILPKPRRSVPRVNAPFEQEAIDSIPTGFSDPNMVPKGSVANPPGKVEKSAEYKIAHSAKEPTKPRSNTVQQEWKALSAKVRRVYLTDALKAEEKMEAKRAAFRQTLHDEAKTVRENLDKVEDSQATKLTLPSIDQSLLLDGPMVCGRSEEETRQLKLKRKANLVTTRLEQATHRDKALLSLYQNSLGYIITEEELNAAVDRAFTSNPVPDIDVETFYKLNKGSSRPLSSNSASTDANAPSKLKLYAALTGNVPGLDKSKDHQAGLETIKDIIGENREWFEALASKKEEA